MYTNALAYYSNSITETVSMLTPLSRKYRACLLCIEIKIEMGRKRKRQKEGDEK